MANAKEIDTTLREIFSNYLHWIEWARSFNREEQIVDPFKLARFIGMFETARGYFSNGERANPGLGLAHLVLQHHRLSNSDYQNIPHMLRSPKVQQKMEESIEQMFTLLPDQSISRALDKDYEQKISMKTIIEDLCRVLCDGDSFRNKHYYRFVDQFNLDAVTVPDFRREIMGVIGILVGDYCKRQGVSHLENLHYELSEISASFQAACDQLKTVQNGFMYNIESIQQELRDGPPKVHQADVDMLLRDIEEPTEFELDFDDNSGGILEEDPRADPRSELEQELAEEQASFDAISDIMERLQDCKIWIGHYQRYVGRGEDRLR